MCPFRGARELGPHLTQCGLGRGLPPYQVTSWSMQPFGHNIYTNVTDRQTDRQWQRSDSIGRAVLQTVAQWYFTTALLYICNLRHFCLSRKIIKFQYIFHFLWASNYWKALSFRGLCPLTPWPGALPLVPGALPLVPGALPLVPLGAAPPDPRFSLPLCLGWNKILATALQTWI